MVVSRVLTRSNLERKSDHLCNMRGRNRIGRRQKWPRKSWEEGEIGRKSREERENVR